MLLNTLLNDPVCAATQRLLTVNIECRLCHLTHSRRTPWINDAWTATDLWDLEPLMRDVEALHVDGDVEEVEDGVHQLVAEWRRRERHRRRVQLHGRVCYNSITASIYGVQVSRAKTRMGAVGGRRSIYSMLTYRTLFCFGRNNWTVPK